MKLHGSVCLGCSMRYSYESIFPTKCAIRNHALDAEDHSSAKNFDSSVTIQTPLVEEDDEEEEFRDDHIFTIKAYKSRVPKLFSLYLVPET